MSAPGRHHQRGAALVVALVAAVLAAVLALGLVERSQRDLARTAALSDAERSWQYASGMEVLARDWIKQARAAGLDAAGLDGRWSAPFEVPGGQVRGRVFDHSGRFNLNALADPEPAAAARALAALVSLLQILELDPGLARELNTWISGQATGAASNNPWYAAQTVPYRPAGWPLVHFSELRWLRHGGPATLERLAPFVTVLPDPRARININHTTPEVLAARIDGLDLHQARQVLAAGPYPDLATAAGHSRLRQLSLPAFERDFSVTSDWYLAQARVVLDRTERDYFRLISLGDGRYDFRYLSQGVP